MVPLPWSYSMPLLRRVRSEHAERACVTQRNMPHGLPLTVLVLPPDVLRTAPQVADSASHAA